MVYPKCTITYQATMIICYIKNGIIITKGKLCDIVCQNDVLISFTLWFILHFLLSINNFKVTCFLCLKLLKIAKMLLRNFIMTILLLSEPPQKFCQNMC